MLSPKVLLIFISLFFISCATAPQPRGAPVRKNERLSALQMVADKTLPLQIKMPPEKPGEWRSYWREDDESPMQYLDTRPSVITEKRNTLYLQPIGDFSPAQVAQNNKLREFCEIYFSSPVIILPTITLTELPLAAVDKKKGQPIIKIIYVTDKLLKPKVPDNAWGLMAITPHDLYKNDGITGLYGDTLLYGRAGIISWFNLQNDFSLMLKGVTHESAHMLSLKHCKQFLCNLNGRIGLDEFHRSPLWLCPDCLTKLSYATTAEIPTRYQKLSDFCARNNLSREAEFYRRAIEMCR